MNKELNANNGFLAEVIADSINKKDERLTTLVVCFPRMILAEFNTHRMLSRNSASSRAIPFEKMCDMVQKNPFIPLGFQKDHKGMQGTEYFEGLEHEQRKQEWLACRDRSLMSAKAFASSGVTKQLCNRILEPFMWHTVVVSATDWENFFALRCDSEAEIHMQRIAYKMLKAMNESEPKSLEDGEWHIPFADNINDDRLLTDLLLKAGANVSVSSSEVEEAKIKIAVARLARVSYLNFEGKDDYEADFKLHDRMSKLGHWSPFEHVAQAQAGTRSGNFNGFLQYRKTFPLENREDSRLIKKHFSPRN